MSAFSKSLWRPGQPLDANTKVLSADELTQRLLYLETVFDDMQVDDLPLGHLQKQLAQNWLPDPATLFASGEIGYASLAFRLAYGIVSGAGAILVGGTGDWNVARNAAGDYTVTMSQPFQRQPVAVASPGTTGPPTTTTSTARFVFSADTNFDFILVGK